MSNYFNCQPRGLYENRCITLTLCKFLWGREKAKFDKEKLHFAGNDTQTSLFYHNAEQSHDGLSNGFWQYRCKQINQVKVDTSYPTIPSSIAIPFKPQPVSLILRDVHLSFVSAHEFSVFLNVTRMSFTRALCCSFLPFPYVCKSLILFLLSRLFCLRSVFPGFHLWPSVPLVLV